MKQFTFVLWDCTACRRAAIEIVNAIADIIGRALMCSRDIDYLYLRSVIFSVYGTDIRRFYYKQDMQKYVDNLLVWLHHTLYPSWKTVIDGMDWDAQTPSVVVGSFQVNKSGICIDFVGHRILCDCKIRDKIQVNKGRFFLLL